MKYRDQLLDLLSQDSDEAITNWIQEQPLLEQPDILRELKELVREIAKEANIQLDDVEDLESFSDDIDLYEDKILDEKLAEAMLVKAMQDRDKSMEEMFEAVEGVGDYVIECIVTNAPNAEAMRELAKHVIKFEKDAGIFNPQKWKVIGES